uniref:ATP-dependent RNA helicase n=1 Tax=Rhizophora mucronata TaxID=61149 RepID=A0A2P2M6E2_RHIMU
MPCILVPLSDFQCQRSNCSIAVLKIHCQQHKQCPPKSKKSQLYLLTPLLSSSL